jgi:hypothetical protein
VVSDREKALALYKAIAADKVDEWMASTKTAPSTQANG